MNYNQNYYMEEPHQNKRQQNHQLQSQDKDAVLQTQGFQ